MIHPFNMSANDMVLTETPISSKSSKGPGFFANLFTSSSLKSKNIESNNEASELNSLPTTGLKKSLFPARANPINDAKARIAMFKSQSHSSRETKASAPSKYDKFKARSLVDSPEKNRFSNDTHSIITDDTMSDCRESNVTSFSESDSQGSPLKQRTSIDTTTSNGDAYLSSPNIKKSMAKGFSDALAFVPHKLTNIEHGHDAEAPEVNAVCKRALYNANPNKARGKIVFTREQHIALDDKPHFEKYDRFKTRNRLPGSSENRVSEDHSRESIETSLTLSSQTATDAENKSTAKSLMQAFILSPHKSTNIEVDYDSEMPAPPSIQKHALYTNTRSDPAGNARSRAMTFSREHQVNDSANEKPTFEKYERFKMRNNNCLSDVERRSFSDDNCSNDICFASDIVSKFDKMSVTNKSPTKKASKSRRASVTSVASVSVNVNEK